MRSLPPRQRCCVTRGCRTPISWRPEEEPGSIDGFYLACIAANNGKSHSHNDTGSFWVYSQGWPVLIDMGQETYQKKSFGAHRYEIPSMQSAYHNLPTIGGVQQGVGPCFGLLTLATSPMTVRRSLLWSWLRLTLRSPVEELAPHGKA